MRNQVKITTKKKKKKNKGVQKKEWIRKVKEWAEGGYEKVDDWVPPPPPPPPVLWQHLEQVFVKHPFAYACQHCRRLRQLLLGKQENSVQSHRIGGFVLTQFTAEAPKVNPIPVPSKPMPVSGQLNKCACVCPFFGWWPCSSGSQEACCSRSCTGEG